tara:strand:- start:644 stop:979 length:336 start_codon:yes stop_codon:yes gene_type:complete
MNVYYSIKLGIEKEWVSDSVNLEGRKKLKYNVVYVDELQHSGFRETYIVDRFDTLEEAEKALTLDLRQCVSEYADCPQYMYEYERNKRIEREQAEKAKKKTKSKKERANVT